MPQYISRGASIDTEKCVAEAGGNRFDLVIMATQRAREIKQQNRHSFKDEHVNGVVSALLEIQAGKFNKDWRQKVR
jgi:DNA-directed RNA polymerase omega subunit